MSPREDRAPPTALDPDGRPPTLARLALAWALATGVVALADTALSRSLGQSLVAHGVYLPVRLPPLLGWALLGTALPLALKVRGDTPRGLDVALAPLSAVVAGVCFQVHEGLPWGRLSLGLLAALALGTPAVTVAELFFRRRTLGPGALAQGVVAIVLAVIRVAFDPESRSWGLAGIVFTASLAAFGATTPTGLSRHRLPVAALATWTFWTCAFWLLLGNSAACRHGAGFLFQWIS